MRAKKTHTWTNRYCSFCHRMEEKLYQWDDNNKQWFCSKSCHDYEKGLGSWKGSRAAKWD